MENPDRTSAERTRRWRHSPPLCVTLRPDIHGRLHKQLAEMASRGYGSRTNINVRDRWFALELAARQVRGSAALRVLEQRADFYFTIRDAISERLITPAEPCVRYHVQADNRLRFWVPKHLSRNQNPLG